MDQPFRIIGEFLIAGGGATAGITALVKGAKSSGRHAQRLKQVEDEVNDLRGDMKKCDDKISGNSEFAARIDERLISLKEGQTSIAETISTGLKELRDMFIQHLKNGRP